LRASCKALAPGISCTLCRVPCRPGLPLVVALTMTWGASQVPCTALALGAPLRVTVGRCRAPCSDDFRNAAWLMRNDFSGRSTLELGMLLSSPGAAGGPRGGGDSRRSERGGGPRARGRAAGEGAGGGRGGGRRARARARRVRRGGCGEGWAGRRGAVAY